MKKWIFGFTMTEMLVVVSIISLLAVASFSTLNVSGKKARDQKRYKDMETIEAALYAYYGDNGKFPTTLNAGNRAWHTICTNNPLAQPYNRVATLIPELVPDYLSSIPQDPRGCNESEGTYHGYIYISDGNNFKLAADWTTELGELCDKRGEKFFDMSRGGLSPGLGANPPCTRNDDGLAPNGNRFCSFHSAQTPDSSDPLLNDHPACW